jgi:hypothetical protein
VKVRSSAPSGRLPRWQTVAAACIGIATLLVLVAWPTTAPAATTTSRDLTLIPGHGSPGTTKFDVAVTGFVEGDHGPSECRGYLKVSVETPRNKVLQSWAEPSPTSSREIYGPFIVPTSSLPASVQVKASCRSATGHSSTLSAVAPFVVDTKPVTSPATTPANGAPATSSATQALALSSSTVTLRGHVTASGQGCTADVPVLITVNSGAIIGWGKTNQDGSFAVPLKLGSLPVGRYRLDAHCDPQLISDLRIVESADNRGSGDSSTPLVIGGIVLLALIAFGLGFLIRKPGPGRHAAARTDARRGT